MQSMKKSLANMQGKLSRAEMKNIMAGEGVMQCAWTNVSGAITYGNCTGTQDQCQSFANNYCASQPRCAGVICGYGTLYRMTQQGN